MAGLLDSHWHGTGSGSGHWPRPEPHCGKGKRRDEKRDFTNAFPPILPDKITNVKPLHNAKHNKFKEGGGGKVGRDHVIHVFVEKLFPSMSKEEVGGDGSVVTG